MKFEFSAGGVVYKKGGDKTLILVAQHSYHHGWVFPKGIIGDYDKKEGKEDTALREVEEETGTIGRILKPLRPVTYWYNFEGEKIKKTVYYFLMEFVRGNTSKHDHEMEDVQWIDQEDVIEKLTYKSDRDVWKQAKEMLTIN